MEQERITPASEHEQHTLPLALGNIFRAEGGLTNTRLDRAKPRSEPVVGRARCARQRCHWKWLLFILPSDDPGALWLRSKPLGPSVPADVTRGADFD